MRTAVCAIARNEIDYIEEWISYYKLIGFDDIFVYDNFSDDGTTELLINLGEQGIVNRVYWPRVEGVPPQRAAYNHFLNRHSKSYDYVFICDVDEFLNLKNCSVKNFIDSALKNEKNISAIAIPWLMFGSGGQVDKVDDLVIKRFTNCAPKPSKQVKSLFNPAKVYNMRTHICDLISGDYVDNSFGLAVWDRLPIELASPKEGFAIVHHYYTKSKAEWDKRRNGLKADRSTESYKKNDEVFERYSSFSDTNADLCQYSVKINSEVENLRRQLALSRLVVKNLVVVRLDPNFLVLKFKSSSENQELAVKLIFDECEYDCLAVREGKQYVLIFKMKWNKTHLKSVGVYVIGSQKILKIAKKDRLPDKEAYHTLLEIAPSANELIYHTFLWGIASGSISTSDMDFLEMPYCKELSLKINFLIGFCKSSDKLGYVVNYHYKCDIERYKAFTALKELKSKKFMIPDEVFDAMK